MKLFLLLIPFLMIGFATRRQESDAVKEVTFQSSTRGYSETIRVTQDSVFIKKEDRSGTSSKSYAVTKEQWKQVISSLQNLDLEEISNLSAPSQDRARDAALHSQIIISTGDNTYTSGTFDDHKAPKPLMPLMQVIDRLGKAK